MSGGSKRPSHTRLAALALVAVWLAATAGCGQSGPLTLPGKHTKRAAAPTQQPKQNRDKKDKDKADASENGR